MSEPRDPPIRSIPPAEPPGGPPDTVTHAATRPPQPTRPFDPAAAVPGFEIVCELGRGGMGVVYEARQARLNRTVALKMVLAGGDVARFLAEAEAVAAVKHPHVVQVFDFGQLAGRPYMALEYLPGGSLADKVRRGGPLPPRAAAEVVEKVARGVQAAHDLGIVHRDLKPANVLFDEAGEPKVADFGLAKRGTGGDLTQTNAVMGTPAYMSPEQAAGRAKFVGPAADVYALGVILFECLTGRRPFEDADTISLLLKVARDDPPPARALAPGVPRDLDLICRKCLAKDPHGRYSSAAAFADDLRRWRSGETITARPAGVGERAWKWAKRNRAAALAAAAVLTALVAGTAVSTWQAVRATEAERETAKQLGLTREAEAEARAAGERARDEAAKARDAEAVARAAAAAAAAAEGVAKDEATKARAAEAAAKRAEGTARDEAVKARAAEELARDRERQEAAARTEAERQRATAEVVRDFLLDVLVQADPEQLAWEGRAADPNRTVKAAVAYAGTKLGGALGREPAVEAAVRHTLGVVHHGLGDPRAAAGEFAAALDLRRRHLGPADPATLYTAASLGVMYQRLGRSADAEALLREAYAGLTRRPGPDHPFTLTAARALSDLYWSAGRPAEAEPYARQVAVGYVRLYGDRDTYTAAALNQLGLVYQDLGRPGDAEPLYRRAASVYRAAFGLNDLKTARVLTNLGVCLLTRGRYAEAEPPLRAGLAARAAAEPDAWGTWNTVCLLGRAVLGQGQPEKYPEAERLLVEGYKELKARAGQIPPARAGRVTEAARHVAWLYDAWGKPAEAAKWRAAERAAMAVEPAPRPRPAR